MRAVLSVALATLILGQEITSDSYFYGQSPPVYPSPIGEGTGDWASAYQKAKHFIAQLTIEEKANLTYGTVTTVNGCAGNIPGIPRLDFPGMCLQDAGNGVRNTDFVNGYASGISVGASWNKRLARERANFMFHEFRAKGVNVPLGPVVGPLGRVAEGGRNWEGFSADPYLSGVLASETVLGGHDAGVITSVKHYIANEQESNRSAVSSNLDDKTMHELYLWPFQDAVKAGAGSIMCSYNRINNSNACSNSKTLNGLLKTELGFQGFVVSDWGGQLSGMASALAGLDMAMPDSPYWNTSLVEGIHNGSLAARRLDDMATRILGAWYYAGQDHDFPTPGIGVPYSILAPHIIVDARDPNAKSTLYTEAVEGHVLVKNAHNALPLGKPRLLQVFGYDAKVPDRYNPNGQPLGWSVGGESTNATEVLEFFQHGFTGPVPAIARYGTIISGGGSGAVTPGHISGPFDALGQRAYVDNTALFWDFDSQNPVVVAVAEACLVFINAFASEAFDRPTIDDDYSNILVNNVADKCANTIVIIHNAGIRLVDKFADHPNVTAIVFAHLPGQASGHALVSLLYGDENFSGKLPYTVAHKDTDYGPLLSPSLPDTPFMYFPQSNFTEGVYVDYLAFQKKGIAPRYELGFGLSYTTFQYSNMVVTDIAPNVSKGLYPTGQIQQGGHVDLWSNLVEVAVQVENSGKVPGQEVVQFYLERMDNIKWLRGFQKVALAPGQHETVTFELTRRDLSEWDVVAQNWKLMEGEIPFFVGASVQDIRLHSVLTL
ncbi:glycosyl hydrolase family 3 N terminal domain-containing protein [Cadophora sp. MPI-SDFR-AT-0126]|nr:glycosyl hydrolase family 3 N terminal domain-containing protein [Leotiomycetes sp. MPI-SDFR-AT-0126]